MNLRSGIRSTEASISYLSNCSFYKDVITSMQIIFNRSYRLTYLYDEHMLINTEQLLILEILLP